MSVVLSVGSFSSCSSCSSDSACLGSGSSGQNYLGSGNFQGTGQQGSIQQAAIPDCQPAEKMTSAQTPVRTSEFLQSRQSPTVALSISNRNAIENKDNAAHIQYENTLANMLGMSSEQLNQARLNVANSVVDNKTDAKELKTGGKARGYALR